MPAPFNTPLAAGMLSIGSMLALVGMGFVEYFLSGRAKRRAYLAHVHEEALQAAGSGKKRDVVLAQVKFLRLYCYDLGGEIARRIEEIEGELEQAGSITLHVRGYWDAKAQEVEALLAAVEAKSAGVIGRGGKKLAFLFTFCCVSYYLLLSASSMGALSVERLLIWGGFGLGWVVLAFLFSRYVYIRLYIVILSKLGEYISWISSSNRFGVVYGCNKLFIYGCVALALGYFHLTYPYIFVMRVSGVTSVVGQVLTGLLYVSEIISALLAFSEVREKLFKKRVER